jgi:hypothetical protein
LLLGLAAFAQDAPTLLGVLEDTPSTYDSEPNRRSVRVVFYKEGAEWKAFPTACADDDCWNALATKYPRQVQWTVAFDGRTLGQVVAQTPNSFVASSTVGQQEISNGADIPTVGRRSVDYGGFLGQPVYRPLVAVSKPYFDDPDGWKRAVLGAKLLAALRKQFHAQFRNVTNCSQNQPETPGPWHYEDADIEVKATFSSNKGWSLAELALNGYRCDGPLDDPFLDQWFVVTPAHEVRYLGGSMWLVDAGDYDHDGSSEVLFSIDDYNRGGYRLFYAGFTKQASFEFSYQ